VGETEKAEGSEEGKEYWFLGDGVRARRREYEKGRKRGRCVKDQKRVSGVQEKSVKYLGGDYVQGNCVMMQNWKLQA
jgi:hypothetical protein